ncbi:hypothetical protein JAAARDRAFT_55964 [Jaapia argillacea MUCL 33604]|uniref:Arrestin C-terminal-like domain-containing protein n=1 Tax=Jaapia argillacea MUCL 33604 TaxID=933084 RepID=A0A067QCQ6_9AGAM|nr:hypothetical protein JAAARDRAFT_55964 [Jaapia argillacea MUCL 33604]
MSQLKLTLRPPPNVEFVHGYPGIPPSAPDRPQAAVKGALELRAGPQGVKAKWVRVELRKVETLPGGGQANTYFDFVGQSPINLWQSSEDYGLLMTQDFPFYIRIPESIPPSLALEKGAGVRYELVATACLKGKRGFFTRAKSTLLSTMAPIIIDKHELHSTWPVYCQPETRELAQDGVILTVERNHTCYGPGDRVSILATIKSDSLHTVILRSFEFALRETVVFRAGTQVTGKKAAPAVRITVIGEQKVPVNATLYGGTQHKVELACLVPPSHNAATLTSARHIDITYTLDIKALMGTAKPIMMALPVVVSNWPRPVSTEAIRRIGPAMGLSLLQAPTIPTQIAQRPDFNPQATMPSRDPQRPDLGRPYNTMPNGPIARPPSSSNGVDEFGAMPSRTNMPVASPAPAPSASMSAKEREAYGDRGANGMGYDPSNSSRMSYGVGVGGGNTGLGPATPSEPTTPSRRPRSSGGAPTNRFTVTNMNENDMPPISERSQQNLALPGAAGGSNVGGAGGSGVGGGAGKSKWMSAEEEKRQLYERARAQAEQVQGPVAARESSPPPPAPVPVMAAPSSQSTTSSRFGPNTNWASAEEEKMRLFNAAQAKARHAQGSEAYSPPSSPGASLHDRKTSIHSLNFNPQQPPPRSAPSSPPIKSSGAALYSQAMSTLNRGQSANATFSTNGYGNAVAGSSSSSSGAGGSQQVYAPKPQYPSAEQEKEMLKRYHQAKAAVDKVQGPVYEETSQASYNADPVAYDALYPTNTSRSRVNGAGPPSPINGDMPPAFPSSSAASPHPPTNALSEKERLRRHFEAQDAAAASSSGMNGSNIPSYDAPSYSSPPPPPPPSAPVAPMNALAEKELLRRKYAAEEAAAGGSTSSAPVPPPVQPNTRSPPPLPPAYDTGSRPLTAAEEKALLKRQYESQDNRSGVSSNAGPSSSGSAPSFVRSPSARTIPPPPPLMPRPPVEYIQETQEYNVRTNQQQQPPVSPPLDSQNPQNGYGLNMRAFSPLDVHFDTSSSSSPPPLPPKFPY